MVDADVIVIGAGLSGLVTATRAAARGRRVIVLDAEPTAALGGQAWWSFGGLLMVDSPEQRRLGVHDSPELAFSDWLGSARFADGADRGRGPDRFGYEWAQRYVEFAAGPMRAWLHGLGVRWFPLVQWAERGGYPAGGHGNTVPRFHVTWGTGPAILAPFVSAANSARADGLLEFRFRHRVVELVRTGTAVTGVRAQVLTPSPAGRGEQSSAEVTGEVELSAGAVVIAAGGIGANHDLVRELWPSGTLPTTLLSGVPDSTDGSMQTVAAGAGAALVHTDRMWHYPEGLPMPAPVWNRHGIRILPGPSSLWLDADGNRLPAPLFPGFDALGALEHITGRGDEHSWFVLNRTIMETEFALSGSDMNPDLTGKDVPLLLKRVTPGAVGPVAEFARHSPEFVWADSPAELAAGMNALVGDERIDGARLAGLVSLRDAQVASGLGKDPQVVATAAARRFWVDRRMRVAPPRPLTTPRDGPLLAVRLHVLTRKTLGGIHTDGRARVLDPAGAVLDGLFAVGEAAGFGGGGIHGHRALEGTFLGGCLFSGRVAAEAV
ncbi:FAD-binding dehydrogenase [Pseudactinotalea sp. HY158]|uniref:FAD-binding dehydrogenase n=1 Tax=Pseudactinotalea sp. HY158 TaxID=2654547 RepID=UPI00129C6070|nr:FAD-binding dehydrogenase [Pseudactinotalea sp. HY158]QGH68917.1 FAD-binding dehydrogenase [Pseudactinotalea sp. HY158]